MGLTALLAVISKAVSCNRTWNFLLILQRVMPISPPYITFVIYDSPYFYFFGSLMERSCFRSAFLANPACHLMCFLAQNRIYVLVFVFFDACRVYIGSAIVLFVDEACVFWCFDAWRVGFVTLQCALLARDRVGLPDQGSQG